MVNVGDVIIVRTYRGKPDKQTHEERIVATEPETGKIVLFDRSEIATKNIVPDLMVDAELTDERATFFLAKIQKVHAPDDPQLNLPKLEHIMGFYGKIDIGTGPRPYGYVIPVPLELLEAVKPELTKGLANKKLRVEVFVVQ